MEGERAGRSQDNKEILPNNEERARMLESLRSQMLRRIKYLEERPDKQEALEETRASLAEVESALELISQHAEQGEKNSFLKSVLERVESGSEGDHFIRYFPVGDTGRDAEVFVFNSPDNSNDYYIFLKGYDGFSPGFISGLFDDVPPELDYTDLRSRNTIHTKELLEIIELPRISGLKLTDNYYYDIGKQKFQLTKGKVKLTKKGIEMQKSNAEVLAGPPYKTEDDLLQSGITPIEIRDGFLLWVSPDQKWCMFTPDRKKQTEIPPLSGRMFKKNNCEQGDRWEDCIVTPAYIFDADGEIAKIFKNIMNPLSSIIKWETILGGTITKK